MTDISQAILQSLIQAPLLLEDLPEAKGFPHQTLTLPPETSPLNFEQKLGHLYENALAQLLETSSSHKLLAQNLQIQKDQHRTVGELDFLIRDLTSGQLVHLELATKFYLAVETPNGLTLPGPDARDNYFKKLARLREHQLQLPSLFKDYLPPEFQNEPILTQHLVNGCIFDHINSANSASPESLNPNCRRGKWLHHKDLLKHFPSKSSFKIIPKPLWPAPFHLLTGIPLETWIQEEPLTRCLMLRIDDEPMPYFMVSNGYPKELGL